MPYILIVHRLTLVFFVIASASLAFTRLVHTEEASPHQWLFTQPVKSPCAQLCLLGIEPGQTAFADAKARLQRHPLLRSAILIDESQFAIPISTFLTDVLSVILVMGNDQRVYTIQLSWRNFQANTAPTLADLQELLDVPRWVQPGQSKCHAFMAFYFTEHFKAVTRYHSRVQPDDPVVFISLSVTRADLGNVAPWQGYTNSTRYGNVEAC
jgi:hypothetical protein